MVISGQVYLQSLDIYSINGSKGSYFLLYTSICTVKAASIHYHTCTLYMVNKYYDSASNTGSFQCVLVLNN